MFLSDPSIIERITELEESAAAFRRKFKSRASAKTLLPEAKALLDSYDEVVSVMPKESIFVGNTRRHFGFMIHYLEQGNKKSNQQDIVDICEHDLPALKEFYKKWLTKSASVDAELNEKVSSLLKKREFDSAIRKAFIVLTSRIRSMFSLPEDKDGPELVNILFGGKSTIPLPLDAAQKQSYRDLFAGLYGTYRNKYAHNDCNPDWSEVLGLISFINLALKELAYLDPKKKGA